ncbi:uncharacterized protein LOC112538881 [Tetranychus urticae]|uniref:uncharacterized protein LOC112538881 n=1 Tax=Tetranychus urticae TaxID=32264 RepID=UPI000D642980|nr:uncharacterized protein LOC112538881 [Tetranychus urticae]
MIVSDPNLLERISMDQSSRKTTELSQRSQPESPQLLSPSSPSKSTENSGEISHLAQAIINDLLSDEELDIELGEPSIERARISRSPKPGTSRGRKRRNVDPVDLSSLWKNLGSFKEFDEYCSKKIDADDDRNSLMQLIYVIVRTLLNIHPSLAVGPIDEETLQKDKLNVLTANKGDWSKKFYFKLMDESGKTYLREEKDKELHNKYLRDNPVRDNKILIQDKIRYID